MVRELVQLIKHSGIYGLGSILAKAVGFFMIPVYTRFLLPHDYGVLEMLDLLLFIAGTLSAMGIYSAVFRFYTASESDKDRKEVVATALLYNAGVSLLFVGGFLLAAPVIAQALLGSATYAPLVRVVSLTLLFSNLAEVPLAYWRVQGRTVLFVSVGLLRAVLGALFLAVSLVVLELGLVGAIYANLLANLLTGLALFGIVYARIPRKLAANKLKPMLRYGIPLVPWSLAAFVLTFSDRFFLRHFGDLTEVGVYALGYKLAGIVAFLVGAPFVMTWQWRQFEIAKREDARQTYARIQTYLLLVSLLVGLGLAVLAKDLVRLMAPPSYWPAARIVPLIVLCYVIENVRMVVMSGIYVQRATHYLALISALVAGANLVLNYLLISRYLAMGAAVATVLSFGLNYVLCYAVAQRVYPVRYENARNAAALALAVVIYWASTLHRLALVGSVLVNLSFLLLFLLLSLMLLDREERSMVRHLGFSIAHQLSGGRLRS